MKVVDLATFRHQRSGAMSGGGEVFPGARIIARDKPRLCEHCSGDHVPEWRRDGKIIQKSVNHGTLPNEAC